MGTVYVDKLDPQSGTALEIGSSGDTITVPTGAGLTVTDEVKTNKISPASGTAFTLGDSGDTFTIPSGATITNSGKATGIGGDNTPNFVIRKDAVTTIGDSTRTKVDLDVADIDTDSGLDATNKRWVVPAGKGGTYFVTYGLAWNSAVEFGVNVNLFKNGAAVQSVWNSNGPEVYDTFTGSFMVALVPTDYLELFARQDSGSNKNAATSDQGLQTFMAGFRLI